MQHKGGAYSTVVASSEVRTSTVLDIGPEWTRNHYGEGFDTETLQARAGSLSFCGFLLVGRFPLVFGLVSHPPGPILESVFMWRVSVDRNLPVLIELNPD